MKEFKRTKVKGRLPRCGWCGCALLTMAELAEAADVPHSTAALRLRSAGMEPVSREGGRDLWYPATALPVVLGRRHWAGP